VQDPTWYGPISIILAVLEVDCASICASVPVFWPVLQQQIGKIFVTKEFAVVHEDRYDLETQLSSPRSPHSRADSDIGLRGLRTQTSKLSAKETHYDDAFVMSQVDPLSSTMSAAAESRAREKPKRKWLIF
jgi:hypothetical protein